jgi:CHASE3 domain sensor protein
MAIPLFWRLILGYSAILLLTIGTSLYSIIQLSAFSKTARAAIDTDYRMIASQETLTDALLSEVRYGGKYLITQSPASYDQFLQFKNDFVRYLSGLKASNVSREILTQLSHVEQLHQGYHDLFEQEMRYIKARQPYAQSRYQQERDKILDNTLRELGRLKEQLQNNVQNKLEQMGSSARTARNIAIVTTLILLILGTTLSLKISATVTKSLGEIKRRTQGEIPDPVSSMPISTIPEIQELSDAFTQRIKQLNGAAEKNVTLVQQVTEEVAARLIALKAGLSDLRASGEANNDQDNSSTIAALIADTDRLVEHCADLNAAAAAEAEVKKLQSRAAPPPISIPRPFGESVRITATFPDSLGAKPWRIGWLIARCTKMLTQMAHQVGLKKIMTDRSST